MSSTDIKALRTRLGLTQEALARSLGVALNTVARWEQGSRRPGNLAKRELARLERRAAKERRVQT